MNKPKMTCTKSQHFKKTKRMDAQNVRVFKSFDGSWTVETKFTHHTTHFGWIAVINNKTGYRDEFISSDPKQLGAGKRVGDAAGFIWNMVKKRTNMPVSA